MNNEKLQGKLLELQNQVKPIDIRAELFKRGEFDFITTGYNELGEKVTHHKQKQALKILTSGKYDEFLYGGAAGGAKSWTGVCWIMFMAINYPGTKYFIARNELKDIVESVYVTWEKVARAYGFTDWKYNAVKSFIKLGNGSHINFIEIKYRPSNPMFEDLGSTEYTCGWIEEVGEIHEKGARVISTRVGRHLNGKYGIKGTVFYTCNPKQNWAKTEFYDKDKEGTLESDKAYLSCLVTENPFIEQDYIRKLKKNAQTDKPLYERLFRGNWEYEDNPYQLADQEMIEAIFDNDHIEKDRKTYITADVARQGSDLAVIGAWKGWELCEIITYDKSMTQDIVHAINFFREKYKVPKTRAIGDGDGVGGGVIDYAGIKDFKNNAKPIRTSTKAPQYRNLQVQCLYMLARKINEGEIWISADLSTKQREMIRQELAQIQSVPSKRDGEKLDCKTKAEIKSDIGRSPDYRDMILMRMWFELKKGKKGLTTLWS